MNFLLTPGGSPRGLSYYSAILPCPLQHWFRYRENPEQRTWGRGWAETGKLAYLMVGTMTHGYLEAYLTVGNTGRLVFLDSLADNNPITGFDLEQAEAWRIWDGYRKLGLCGPTDFTAEINIEDASGDLGVPLITTRIDGVGVSEGAYGPDLILPLGKYLWEHKTAGKHSATLFEKHRLQVQLNCYLYNKQNPDSPVLGGILNNIVKTKEITVERLFIALPDQHVLDNLRATLSFLWHIHENFGQQMVTTKKTCGGDWSPCTYYQRCWK